VDDDRRERARTGRRTKLARDVSIRVGHERHTDAPRPSTHPQAPTHAQTCAFTRMVSSCSFAR
jgi:hypothetical protein